MLIRIGLAVKNFSGFQNLTNESDIQTQILTQSDIKAPEFIRSNLDLIIWQPEFSAGKFPDALLEFLRHNSKTRLAVYNVNKTKLNLPEEVSTRVVKEITESPGKHNLKLLVYNTTVPGRSRFQSSGETVQDENDLPLVGDSKSLKHINDFVNVISKSRKTHCLIRGEKGTEKEHIARLIHFKSNDASKPFYFVNCKLHSSHDLRIALFGSLPELQDGIPEQTGYLDQTSEGTIVLNDIESIDQDVQEQLLLYVDEGVFRRVNASEDISSGARIIAMTEYDLEAFLQYTHFSKDLFFRLRAFELNVTPLRNRKTDILPLANFYLHLFNRKYDHKVEGFEPDALQRLQDYHWPGNVDELRLMIERVVLINRKGTIALEALPFAHSDAGDNGSDINVLGNCSLQDIERVHIKRVLTRTNGNKSKAAEILNISRTTLREKMRSFDIN